MKKRLLVRSFLLTFVAIAGVLLLLFLTRPTHHVNRASFAEIEPGMTKDTIETLLNCAPGDHGRTPLGILENDGSLRPIADYQFFLDVCLESTRNGKHSGHIWAGDEGAIMVQFRDNIVTRAAFWDVRSLGVVPTVRRWLTRLGLSS